MNINPNPAIVIEVKSSDTFDDFARNVAMDSHVALRPSGVEPKDAKPEDDVRAWKVEVEPGSNRSIIELDLEEILTPEQFAAMMPYVQEMMTKIVAAGIIKPTTFRGIRTLFDLIVPSLPERFTGDVPTRWYLNGDLGFMVQREPVQPEME